MIMNKSLAFWLLYSFGPLEDYKVITGSTNMNTVQCVTEQSRQHSANLFDRFS